MSDQSHLSVFAEAMRPMAREMFREMLVSAMTPLFGTSEQRATAQAQVDAMSDDEIEERMARWTEAVSKVCPECHRPYDAEDDDE